MVEQFRFRSPGFRGVRTPFAALVLIATVNCSGAIGGQGGGAGSQSGANEPGVGPGGHTGSGGGGGGVHNGAPPTFAPAARPARRLTRFEYNNTVRDLLGELGNPASGFPADDAGALGYSTALNASDLMVTTVAEAADQIAGRALARLSQIVPCAAAANDACAETFIASFGRRAFRRPLTTEERGALIALFRKVRSELGYDFPGGVRVLLSAFLQSPQFLYRWELGTESAEVDGDAVRLSPYELASGLSYFLWASMPDDELLDAAAAGKLSTPDQIGAAADRMLADRKARDAIGDLFFQTYHLDAVLRAEKDSGSHPEWTPELRALAAAESHAFVTGVLLDGDARLSSLFAGDRSFLNAKLAQHYGLPAITGTELRATPVPADRRAGLFTQAAFLSAHAGPADGALATPIKRGESIRKQVLCQTIPPPQVDITGRPSGGNTVRERLSQHTDDAQCAACHHLMDPLGLAFEHYDVTGRYRQDEKGFAIDTRGVVQGLATELPFEGALDIVRMLSGTPEAQECMLRNVIRYATRREESAGEIEALAFALRGGGGEAADLDIRTAMNRFMRGRGFTHRAAAEGEVLP